ncbi:hypothetical protein NM688_g3075 [Phlebia brevispora]|uniref:Uncharacterized protein n=1 Tax=Phlebia brevispora TaxID=194682 RepID=A0ACC1T6X0_9APHY|nr:hypothetical protein NM688_g3075 [Phlebia brevispora]
MPLRTTEIRLPHVLICGSDITSSDAVLPLWEQITMALAKSYPHEIQIDVYARLAPHRDVASIKQRLTRVSPDINCDFLTTTMHGDHVPLKPYHTHVIFCGLKPHRTIPPEITAVYIPTATLPPHASFPFDRLGYRGFVVLRETYAPVLRLRIAKHERHGDAEKADTALAQLQGSEAQGHRLRFLWRNMSRPFILLTRSLVCFVLSLYMAYMNGIYYLMSATFPALFQNRYGFSPGITGLCYIGLGLGFLAATFFGAYNADKIYHALSSRNGGQGKPEYRIPALIFGSLFVPLVRLVCSSQDSLDNAYYWFDDLRFRHDDNFLYLVDTFAFAASALAASSVFRSMLGFAFPLFGQQMYNALGYGGGNSLLAGLAIVLGIPFPVWLYFYGEHLRQRSTLKL